MLRLSPTPPLFGPLLLLALLVASRPARAQQAAADVLFESGRAAQAKGDFAAACAQFRASEKLDPAVGTELNLADCEEQRGHLASAWELYRRVGEQLADSDERFGFARARAQALEPRVPKLALTLASAAPKNSSVRIDGVDLGSGAFGVALPLEPGSHELVVSAPGFELNTSSIELVAGQTEARTVSPGPAVSAAQLARPTPLGAPSEPEPRSVATPRASGRRTLGLSLGGVGVAGLAVGAVAGLLEQSREHAVDAACHPDRSCNQAGLSAARSGQTLERISNVGWVVGAAALATGAYFLLTNGPSSQPATGVALSPTPVGGQVSVSRSW